MTGDANLRPALLDVLRALALSLSEPQVDKLLAYVALLARWNAVYNLTSVREPAAMLTQHLADCLAVVAPLRRELGDRPATLLDVGSGGGLPAVIIATALPAVQVTSVDAVGKKAAFIQQVAAELGLQNLQALHARVERLQTSTFDMVSSRAFASLADFARLSDAALRPGGRWMAMKGRMPDDEVRQLPLAVEVFHVEQLEVPGLSAQRCLVWMRRRLDSMEMPSL